MRIHHFVAAVLTGIILIAGTQIDAAAQARGGASTAPSIADLQRQIDELRAIVGSSTRRKLLYGEVFGNGTSSGPGWTGVANGNGSYTVTFTKPFLGPPTVVATSSSNPAAPTHVITFESVEATGFIAYLSEGIVGHIGAENWYFIVIGR